LVTIDIDEIHYNGISFTINDIPISLKFYTSAYETSYGLVIQGSWIFCGYQTSILKFLELIESGKLIYLDIAKLISLTSIYTNSTLFARLMKDGTNSIVKILRSVYNSLCRQRRPTLPSEDVLNGIREYFKDNPEVQKYCDKLSSLQYQVLAKNLGR